jgi:FkbM family methyltransferase
MNFTKFALNKIKWLYNTEEFKKQPIIVILRVLSWEFFRKLNRRKEFLFDNDLKIYLYPNDGVARLTYYFGYHESSVFQFLDTFLREGMTYCDIGANIGLYTIFAAKRVGRTGKVISFEPQSETFRRMIKNIQLNNLINIITVNKAVGDVDGFITILQDEDSAKSFVSKSVEKEKNPDTIEVINFDSFIKKQQIYNIDYLKIDVEGFEYNVLIGMKNFLKNTPPKIIQIELYENFLNRSGSSINQVKEFFSDLDYSFYKLNPKLNKLSKAIKDFEGDFFVLKNENISNLSQYIIQ